MILVLDLAAAAGVDKACAIAAAAGVDKACAIILKKVIVKIAYNLDILQHLRKDKNILNSLNQVKTNVNFKL